jgi:CubicO group peptidase (beta-lactamase class C family)
MTTTDLAIHGHCDERFASVKEAFTRNFDDQPEVGAAVAVTIAGQLVVDVWAGFADRERTRPWERDTIVNVFSTTKGIVTVCALRLVEQGKLDPDAPVAQYWPEFAAAGKEKITVAQLMSHQAGLPAIDAILPLDQSYAWEPLVTALAAQKPWWEPGTRGGYHAITFGHLVGELVRRISGKSVGAYWRDEFATPLGLDFHIGFGPELDARCADMIPAGLPDLIPDHPLTKAFMDPTSMTFKAFTITPLAMVNPVYMNGREWRAAEIPAGNGHSDARSLAALYGALATDGTLNGQAVLKPETVKRATEQQVHAEDAVLFFPMRFGLGFLLDIPEFQVSPTGALFGHAGMGGSFGYADPDAGFGVGYVMNRMMMPDLANREDGRWRGMFDAIYASL